MDYSKKSLADALAADYVAGLLRGPARRRFEALLPAHPALRDAVGAWQARLMPLTVALPPQAPPPSVWHGIERRLWAQATAAAVLPWWQRAGPWRALAGLAGVAALSLALLAGRPQPAQAPIVVVLQSTGTLPEAGGSIVASFSGDGRALVARPVTPVAVAPDRVLQLWWAPPTGRGGPTSMGLIKPDGVTVLPREGLTPEVLRQIDHMAVSVEPPGGSPTGLPTGPVVFYGDVRRP